ncbi:hypothetical protein ACWGH3_26220 [Streptomyces sp. NPDC054884]|uniref:hypothetical protein n=1 Tax=Streptomyces sp. ME08-AFT2 TaxID=3028683 RepID=UPI0029C041A2|nr:hypothetical protein [Streptomyces sp. ME08-AFT2]
MTWINLGNGAVGTGGGLRSPRRTCRSKALTRMSALPPGTTVVALSNDGGEKYMDTVFDDDRMAERDRLSPQVECEADELMAKLRHTDAPRHSQEKN